MNKLRSDVRSEGHSSPEPTDSHTIANSNISGDYSGNSSSNNNINISNTTVINNYDRGNTGPSGHHAPILQCLYTSRYGEHRSRVSEPAEGTCIWVTEHRKYKDWWEKEKSGLLWLSADPGCGKSVTASFLVKHLENQTDAIVCYFFFKDDSDEQRHATFALCAILHQLFKRRRSLCVFAQEEFEARGKGFTSEVDILWDILVKAVVEGGCGNVICVMDALDECEEVTRTRLIHHVTRISGPQTPDIPLKFLVTSRPYHKIESKLGSAATTIRLKGEEEVPAITADVTRVIDEGIRELESHWERPGELGYLRNLLESLADRTFLWVSLVLEILKNSEDDSPEEFKSIVSTAPPDIAELYTKILDKSTNPDKARRILHIVVAAARPLTLQEMNVASRIRRVHKASKDIGDLAPGFQKTVKNLCGLFVRVIDSKIFLVHQTAREFLLQGSSRGLGSWQYTLCPENSNFILADICITYLSLEDFENDPLVMDTSSHHAQKPAVAYREKYNFLDYAARNWADHFRDARDQQMRLFETTRLICKAGSKRFLTWLQVYWASSAQHYEYPRDFTHLMIATWLGHGVAVQQLLEDRDMDARSELYGTALNIAALRKDKGITKMLVEKNVKAYISGEEYNILQTKRSELERLRRLPIPGLLPPPFFLLMRQMIYWESIDFIMPFCIQDTQDLNTLPSQSTTLS